MDLRLGDEREQRGRSGARSSSTRRSTAPDGRRPLAPSAHDPTPPPLVIHTSGTTGAPRPVELTYGNWLWSALGSAAALGLDPRRAVAVRLPLSHVGGLWILVRAAIYGTTVVLHERFDADAVADALHGRVDARLARAHHAQAGARRRPAQPPRAALRALGGGPVPPELLERARAGRHARRPDLRPHRGVLAGPTTGEARHRWPPAPRHRGALDAGGEILVRGPTVAPASRDADGSSTPATSACSTARPPARGRRAGETIVTGGENVAPAEVEAAARGPPGRRPRPRCSVAPTPNGARRSWPRSCCRPGASADAEELRAHAAGRLAGFKVPKEIERRDEPLPRTASGKLRRAVLR